MITTLILKLSVDRLAEGKLVGSVERVDDGATEFVGSADELVAFALRSPAEAPAKEP